MSLFVVISDAIDLKYNIDDNDVYDAPEEFFEETRGLFESWHAQGKCAEYRKYNGYSACSQPITLDLKH